MFVYVLGVGGLGNSLFQLAAAIYYCEKYNYDLKIVKNDTILFGTSNMFQRIKCLKTTTEFITYDKTFFSKLQFVEQIDTNTVIIHNDYTNTPIIPNDTHILISGYNQNIGLFASVMSEIPKYLRLDDTHIKNYILEKYSNIKNSTVICVRIGNDFKHMNKITPKSYLKAVEFLKNDEINNIFTIGDVPIAHDFLNIDYIDINEPDIIQFYAGLLCKNIILSESTFHLWIAYLGTDFGKNIDKKVICFNDTDITNRNLNLENWIVLNY